MRKPISKKKLKLISEWQKLPVKVGDLVNVKRQILGYSNNPLDVTHCKVEKLGKKITVSHESSTYKIDPKDILNKFSIDIGPDPFERSIYHTRSVAFTLSSIVHALDLLHEDKETYHVNDVEVKYCNWNPSIIDKKGNKKYYQRDLVWKKKDKQLLIESIYHNIDCGKILIRKRGWDDLELLTKQGETDIAFNDIVDGKQRLDAIRGFLTGKFKDLHGNYYSDLSDHAQMSISEHQLFSYSEMPESSTDEEVIHQFLKLNFTGVPQSKKHIEYVKSLL